MIELTGPNIAIMIGIFIVVIITFAFFIRRELK
jgi:hypothetical protein